VAFTNGSRAFFSEHHRFLNETFLLWLKIIQRGRVIQMSLEWVGSF